MNKKISIKEISNKLKEIFPQVSEKYEIIDLKNCYSEVKLLSNNSSWYAHSSSVLKNCRIKRLYAKREKRYFDKSKLNMLSLMEHSLRVNVVFLPRIFIISLIYSSVVFWAARNFNLDYLIIFLILIFNILLLFIRKKHYIKDLFNLDNLIDNIKSL